MSPFPEFRLELERDAAAMIALWLLIHGGDPAPGEVEVSEATSILVSGVVAQLNAEFADIARPLDHAELAKRFGRLGLELGDAREHAVSEDEVISRGGFTCVKGPDDAPGCCVRLAVAIGPRK
jgi:hypothetical protein